MKSGVTLIQTNNNRGSEIILDLISRGDLATMLSWRNDPRVFSWCRQHDLINEINHLGWFEKSSVDPTIKMYSIKKSCDKSLVGICGFTSIDLINRRAEFSLYIGPEHWGNSLGLKALGVLCEHGFCSYGFNIIWGETFDKNPAIKTFESLGFKREGTRREFYFKNGKFIDAHLYSLKKDEFLW